jgi:trk system potassium uptake protein TrkH
LAWTHDRQGWSQAFYWAVLISLIYYIFKDFLHFFKWVGSLQIQPARTILFLYVILIFISTLGLLLPKSSTTGISPLQVLFTSTSAASVTGLSVINIGTDLTWMGQMILLITIQLGGLGIMSLSCLTVLMLGKTTNLRHRILLAECYYPEQILEIQKTLFFIVVQTFIIEVLGTWLIFQQWHGLIENPYQRLWYSLFHAVSAYCNAGFSLLPQNLATLPFDHAWGANLLLTFLVMLGSMGYLIPLEMIHRLKSGIRKKWPLQIKVILGIHVFLWISGTLFYIVAESSSGDLLSLAGHGFIHSVMTRTAGFNVTDIQEMKGVTHLWTTLWMWFGGAPGSTAGGIKLTTLLVILLTVRSVITGSKRIRFAGWEIDWMDGVKSLSVAAISLCFILISTLFIAWSGQFEVSAVIYEVVSAISTVGLSMGITPLLPSYALGILMFLMLAGRMGVLLFMYAFARKNDRDLIEYPKTKLTIG